LILTLLGFIGKEIISSLVSKQIDEAYEKPSIAGRILKLEIFKKTDGRWRIAIHSEWKNRALQSTTLNIESISLLYPDVMERYYEFRLNKSLKISGNDVLNDSTEADFPEIFDVFEICNVPKASKGFMRFSFLPKEGIQEYWFDSSQYAILPAERFRPPTATAFDTISRTINPVTWKKYLLDYKGGKYECYFFPPQVEVKHRVNGDSIIIQRGGDINSVNSFVFAAHPAIRTNVFMGQKMEFVIKGHKANDKRILPFTQKIDLCDHERKIIYLWKDQI